MINRTDRIVVTGGTGFLGQSVIKELHNSGFKNTVALRGSYHHDLTKQEDVSKIFDMFSPHSIIHLAARVGGIGANKENPGRFIYENMAMGLNLIEESRVRKIKKFIMVGTVCSYPKFTPVPFKEEDLWKGYPEETNAPYGIAKKALMQMVESYHEQYGFQGVNLIPVNMYGPRDNFNPASSHVIPALILKIHEAMINDNHEDLEIWGTGNASREFLYVDDCAVAIRKALMRSNDPEPINIGTGEEISIKDLVTKIAEKMGYEGQLIFNPDYPDGQPRRCLDTSRAKERIDFKASVGFDEGLDRTIKWFKNNVRHINF